MPGIRPLLIAIVALLASPAGAQRQIVNTATLTAHVDGADQVIRSNTVSIDVAAGKRPTKLGFRLLPLGYALQGFFCDTTGPVPIAHPADIDAATLAQAPVVTSLDIQQPVIMVLDNVGGNHDPTVRETSYIEVDTGHQRQRIALLETAPDSGVFAGALPQQLPDSPIPTDACRIQLGRGDTLALSFAEDPYSYGSTNSILVDPAGYVFDSLTAKAVDGATVSLVDLGGRPARVFGDDGVSAYPATMVSGASVTDASGRVYPAEPGRYRFPFAPAGQYRLLVVPPPGYTAPSTADRTALAALRTAAGAPYILNAASYGGSLTLAGMDPFYADIPIDPAAAPTELMLDESVSVREASPGDIVQYRLHLTDRGQAATGAIQLTVTLPSGVRPRAESLRGGAVVIAGDGRTLTVTLASLSPGASSDVTFLATVSPGAPIGEAVSRSTARGTTVISNDAAAAFRIRALLFTDALTVLGRVSEGECGLPARTRRGVPGVRLLLDGTFVGTDRDGLYHLEGVSAGRHVVALDPASVPAGLTPIACEATPDAASATTRFVEGVGGLVRRVDFQLRRTAAAASLRGAADNLLPIVPLSDAAAAGDRDWLAGQAPGTEWLFPAADYNPRAPVTRVAIKHPPGTRIALMIDGQRTDPLAFDATDSDGEDVAVSRWVGIPLVVGDNHLVARVLAEDGHVVTTLERTVVVSGAPARATLDATHSRLVADGVTRPLLALRVTDAHGRPVRAGTLVPVIVDAPHVVAIDADLDQRRQLAGRERARPTARVIGDDGVAFVALQPTSQAGAVHLHVPLGERDALRTSDIEAWLVAATRGWTVVGFGAGSLGYDLLSRRAQSLPAGDRGGPIADGQLALYAKGRIKGRWLLTLAYDSARRFDPDRPLMGTIDPGRYYTVYGDGSAQGYDAPTRRRLYLRLETRDAYALFGDMETGFTDTKLTRYSRTLTGLKAAWRGSAWRAAGFAARTDTLAARDEIQGNGLSGPYRLRVQNIVPGSDTLRIEVRDRYRSEVIVASTAMTRHVDYDIDPVAGTIHFHAPVLGRDDRLNPIFIVVDYEVEGGRAGRLAAGARVMRRIGRVEIGAAALHDETVGRADVVGVDVKAPVGHRTVLRGEAATGGAQGLGDGRAFLAEVEHHAPGLDLLAYARQQDAGFGVGQQNLVEAGTRKLGVDVHWTLLPGVSLTGNGWDQRMLAGPGERIAGEARIEWRRGPRTLFVGGQVASDRGLDGGDRDSRLLTFGGSQALAGGAVTVAGQTQVAPGGDKASVDFPVRHQLTAAWRVSPGIKLMGGYEIEDGAAYRARTVQLGFDVAPWTGAKLMSTLDQQAIGENGRRSLAHYGLSQSLPLGQRWSVDATLDAATTLSGAIPAAAMVSPFQPVAAAGALGADAGDYLAATLGATYRAPRWSATTRLEYRRGATDKRWGLTAGALRALGEGSTMAASLHAYRVTDSAGATSLDASADVAVAWRQPGGHWSLLERLTLRHVEGNPVASGSYGTSLGTGTFAAGIDQVTTRAIANLAADWRGDPDGAGARDWRASLYYGAKYVAGRYDDERAAGFIDVVGVDVRRGLGRRLDIGVGGSIEHGWSDGTLAWSGGPAVGAAPADGFWLTAGYNVAGYRDRDFTDARYSRQGPYVTVRFGFDAQRIGDLAHGLWGVGR